MNYDLLKKELARDDLQPGNMFEILRHVSKYVNNKETYDLGRDLVIRSLARQDICQDFEKTILVSLVRLVGLYPYMTETLTHADALDRLAYELHRPDNIPGVLHSLQAKIYHLLRGGSNVVLSASTSAGKSLLVDAMIALGKFKKVVIIVPTLALIDETRKRLSTKFREQCRIITHPSQTADLDKINVYVLTQERVIQRLDLDNVDFFVVDEFYKLDLSKESDLKRAEDLNTAFHRLASSGAQFYMLGPNVEGVRGLNKFDIHFISRSYATVAADTTHYGLPRSGDARLMKLIDLCKELTGPTLIYCQGPGSASKVADRLGSRIDEPVGTECIETSDWISENLHPDWVGASALRNGIGIHHGGVPRALQQHMVRLFNQNKIRFLICTSTLIEGVNTVAENVIMYDRRKGNPKLDYFTYKNIHGRAGRMGKYFIGKIHVLEDPIEEAETIVEYALGQQNNSTPLSLLLQLDDDQLTDDSRERIEEALSGVPLARDTVSANSYIQPELQGRIAREIASIMRNDETQLVWSGIPSGHQLKCVCDIIVRNISGPRFSANGISSVDQLVWFLRNFSNPGGLRHLLAEVAAGKREHQSTSQKLDEALRVVRNVLTYRFPQDLMALNRIQADVAKRMRKPVGHYGYYAESLENMFLPPTLAALEEYGLPHQVARKLASFLAPHHDLDMVLERLKGLSQSSMRMLTPFERGLVLTVREDV